MKDGDIEHLLTIVRFEREHDMEKEYKIGWAWRHVRIWPATLNRLFKDGYIQMIFRSNSYTGYRLSDLGKNLLEIEQNQEKAKPKPERPVVVDSLFGDIIGHDEVKELLRACLLAEKPVHVLLAGPPALAKSLFLWDIERAAGEQSIWLVGSATSKAGLWDVVSEREPKYLLIDELDKMNTADTAALLSMMEGGRLVRAKKGRELDINNEIRVIAASNRLKVLSPELRSRFAIRTLTAYNREDFRNVVQGVLTSKENIDTKIACEIAVKLDGRTQDMRDAIRVARLTPQLGADKAISLLLEGKS